MPSQNTNPNSTISPPPFPGYEEGVQFSESESKGCKEACTDLSPLESTTGDTSVVEARDREQSVANISIVWHCLGGTQITSHEGCREMSCVWYHRWQVNQSNGYDMLLHQRHQHRSGWSHSSSAEDQDPFSGLPTTLQTGQTALCRTFHGTMKLQPKLRQLLLSGQHRSTTAT